MTAARVDGGAELLRVENLVKTFPAPASGGAPVQAVAGVSFELARGESLGIVGETGSGKSTLARAILQLPAPTSGSVRLRGVELTELSGRRRAKARRGAQMVFQDPSSALDSRWTVTRIIDEPLRAAGLSAAERRDRVAELIDLVGLDPHVHGDRHHRELSGGQQQRVTIARAVALDPDLLVCDEPVSALDVSVQAQIINLLEELRGKLNLSYIFVSHDLSMVRHLCDRVAVMYLGRFCEVGETETVFRAPAHPYTRALLDSVPGGLFSSGAERLVLSGELPSPSDPPSGCRFRTRCPLAQPVCAEEPPAMVPTGSAAASVACHFPLGRLVGQAS